MLNAILASLTVAIWTTSYSLFFARDVRRWYRLRHHKRAAALTAREQALRVYAAWIRNIPPPRSRLPAMPTPLPDPVPATPARTALVVQFPRNRVARRR
jgi:hypothetical protein